MAIPKIAFTAVGDFLIQRRIPEDYEGFDAVRNYICRGDARYFNLEATLHRAEHWGNQFYGGSYVHADPACLNDAAQYGFNMLSFCNNHTMDYSYGGMFATLDEVREKGFVNAGVGENLDEASAPAYLDVPQGRVALISAVSSMNNPAMMAGKQSRRVRGRPGVNGLRFDERIVVTPEQFGVIQEIAEKSGINSKERIARAEGYRKGPGAEIAELKDVKFVVGDKTTCCTSPNKTDMARIEKAIYEAQMQSDYILVSIHCHEVAGMDKTQPPQFLQEFAHRCIDAGAHAVIGHGPHLLRPLEIYKNRPIFYSLGDFVLHNENTRCVPEDLFELYGLSSDDTMRDLFEKRSKNYTVGLARDRRMLESVIPYFEFENGEMTHLELMPISLGYGEPPWRSGNPRFCTDRGIIENFAKLSAPFGTEITVDARGMGVVNI